jgi:hypothetical protein
MAAQGLLGLTEFAGLVITQSQTTSNHCLSWIILFITIMECNKS